MCGAYECLCLCVCVCVCVCRRERGRDKLCSLGPQWWSSGEQSQLRNEVSQVPFLTYIFIPTKLPYLLSHTDLKNLIKRTHKVDLAVLPGVIKGLNQPSTQMSCDPKFFLGNAFQVPLGGFFLLGMAGC